MLSRPHVPLSRRSLLAGLAALALPSRSEADAGSDITSELVPALAAFGAWARGVGGRFGACFVDVASGRELGSFAADVAENPASNEKLVTAGAVLRHLGGRFTFTSGLYGAVDGGKVTGLVLRSDGDPSLSSADLAGMARALRDRGVREVSDILLDHGAFDRAFVPPGFEQQPGEWAAFRAPVSAVAVDRNSVLVSIVPARQGVPAAVSFEPASFVDVEGRIETGPRGKRGPVRVSLAPRGQRLVARLGGAVPEGSPPNRYRQRVDDPELFAGYALREALLTAGITLTGAIRSGGADERRELAVHRSKPLAELLAELGKQSDNFYAEMLLKVLDARVNARPGTSAGGAELAAAWLKEIGAADAGTRVGNGSGLFDSNRLSPKSLARLLVTVFRDPALSPDFASQLAVGGVDGTLKTRFASLAAARSVLAKTGTLRDVVALSGYVFGADRARPVAFSMIVSGVAGRTPAARARVDEIVERVAAALAAGQKTAS
ncbi:MAG TPA: D-alanyl-D-alanine carboxypeptidase/D-alanyl-D-alanine-endopeptidase [Polyangiaceae bacterium]